MTEKTKLIYPVEVYIDHGLRARFPDIVIATRRHCGASHWYLGGEIKKGGWIRCPGANGWMRCPFRLWVVRWWRGHIYEARLRALGYTTNEMADPGFTRITEREASWAPALEKVLTVAEEALAGWPR